MCGGGAVNIVLQSSSAPPWSQQLMRLRAHWVPRSSVLTIRHGPTGQQDLHFAEEETEAQKGGCHRRVGSRGVQVGDPSSFQGSLAVPPPTTPAGWARAHLHGGDLHGRGTCGGGRARRHGGLRLCLGVRLGLHLSQGLLRDHEQRPILAPHEDHTWGAGEGAGVRNAPRARLHREPTALRRKGSRYETPPPAPPPPPPPRP